MSISITFRQMEATDAVRNYATDKVTKLQKFLRQPLKAQVTLSSQKSIHAAEVDIHSGGEHYHATESSEDMYASVDRAIDKIEAQIRHTHGVNESKKKGAERASQRLLPDVSEE